jgi:hypothetical protein
VRIHLYAFLTEKNSRTSFSLPKEYIEENQTLLPLKCTLIVQTWSFLNDLCLPHLIHSLDFVKTWFNK